MCLFPEENQQPILGFHRFSEEKWHFRMDVKKQCTFIDENQRTNSLKSASLTIMIQVEYLTIQQQRQQQRRRRQQQQQASDSSVPFLLWCPFKSNPSGRLMADRASGAAWRRRQRRLRSWWRYEQQTVAAVLATVTHHSHSKVGTANAALRGQ